jgi:hypothetical protein
MLLRGIRVPIAPLRSWQGLTSNNNQRYWSQWRDRAGLSPASSTRISFARYVSVGRLSILKPPTAAEESTVASCRPALA